MKPLLIVLSSVLLSTGAATAAVLVLAPEPVVEGAPKGAVELRSPEIEALREEIASQRALVESLSKDLALRTPQAAPVRTSAEDVEAVVRRVLASERGTEPIVADNGDPEETPEISIEATVAEIAAIQMGEGTFDRVETYYAEMRKRGVPSSHLLAAFERYAAARPQDPDAQVVLGDAYIQRLQEAKNGPEMGQWAMRADGSYDDALALDETHWGARFSKAVSLSFWPPIFGKQGEAIRQFETLLDQQKGAPAVEDHFADTYVFLGNLYEQQGDAEKAQAIWQEGYDAFPEHEDLAGKTDTDGTY